MNKTMPEERPLNWPHDIEQCVCPDLVAEVLDKWNNGDLSDVDACIEVWKLSRTPGFNK